MSNLETRGSGGQICLPEGHFRLPQKRLFLGHTRTRAFHLTVSGKSR